MTDRVVYYGERDGRIKIGCTGDLRRRARALGIRVLAFEAGDFKTERERHDEFAHLRIESEWYRPDPMLLAHIESVGFSIPTQEPPQEPPSLMRSDEVAALLKVNRLTVVRWAQQGVLPAVFLSARTIRFKRSVIDTLMEPGGLERLQAAS